MAALRVPSEFGTIEAAQNAANEGDTILLAPGTVQAPAIYTQPFCGIVKPIHIKGEDETDPSAVSTIIEMYATAGQAAYKSCLRYVFPEEPAITTLYVEGVRFRMPSGWAGGGTNDEVVIYLNGATGLANKQLIVNRCTIVTNSGKAPEHVIGDKSGCNVRFRNCYLTAASSNEEGWNIDAGELHLERCHLASAPWGWDAGSARKILDTADYVSVAAAGYGTAYGEWLAPWFMAANTFRYRGMVTVNGIPPSAALPVHLIRRTTGAFVATTTCAAGSGEYSFVIPAAEAQYDHLIISVGTDPTRPLAHWPINPELV